MFTWLTRILFVNPPVKRNEEYIEPNRDTHIKAKQVREFKNGDSVIIKKTNKTGIVVSAMWDWPNFDYCIQLDSGCKTHCFFWDYELTANKK